ncbi:hypothetical protein HELRODRAFT_176026 [Helobdella robusta]|uniref:Uncharacterized protein n=1 Tax=Helobdella robusta TaxID=6412 RepID=T1FA16_HELRO|nr:hypothetical protein HELRODRAFT_176026 [Helobdella robusta]ESO00192.1 hypothetical protein HELRODRAFT_176026 [Helobdella robusta]
MGIHELNKEGKEASCRTNTNCTEHILSSAVEEEVYQGLRKKEATSTERICSAVENAISPCIATQIVNARIVRRMCRLFKVNSSFDAFYSNFSSTVSLQLKRPSQHFVVGRVSFDAFYSFTPVKTFKSTLRPDADIEPDIYGRKMNRFIDIAYSSQLKHNLNIDPYVQMLVKRLQIIQEKTKQNVINNQIKSKAFFDRGKSPINFVEGSKVWLLNRRRRVGENPKFYQKYVGPFIVEKNEGYNRYLLKDINTDKPFKYTVNGNSLKKFYDVDQDKNDKQQSAVDLTTRIIKEVINKTVLKPVKYLVKYTNNEEEWLDKHIVPQSLINDYHFSKHYHFRIILLLIGIANAYDDKEFLEHGVKFHTLGQFHVKIILRQKKSQEQHKEDYSEITNVKLHNNPTTLLILHQRN